MDLGHLIMIALVIGAAIAALGYFLLSEQSGSFLAALLSVFLSFGCLAVSFTRPKCSVETAVEWARGDEVYELASLSALDGDGSKLVGELDGYFLSFGIGAGAASGSLGESPSAGTYVCVVMDGGGYRKRSFAADEVAVYPCGEGEAPRLEKWDLVETTTSTVAEPSPLWESVESSSSTWVEDTEWRIFAPQESIGVGTYDGGIGLSGSIDAEGPDREEER